MRTRPSLTQFPGICCCHGECIALPCRMQSRFLACGEKVTSRGAVNFDVDIKLSRSEKKWSQHCTAIWFISFDKLKVSTHTVMVTSCAHRHGYQLSLHRDGDLKMVNEIGCRKSEDKKKKKKRTFSPLHPYTHRTQRLVWVPWCDSRNRKKRTFPGTRLDVFTSILCAYHVLIRHIAFCKGTITSQKMTFLVQVGTFLCLKVGHSSAMRFFGVRQSYCG